MSYPTHKKYSLALCFAIFASWNSSFLKWLISLFFWRETKVAKVKLAIYLINSNVRNFLLAKIIVSRVINLVLPMKIISLTNLNISVDIFVTAMFEGLRSSLDMTTRSFIQWFPRALVVRVRWYDITAVICKKTRGVSNHFVKIFTKWQNLTMERPKIRLNIEKTAKSNHRLVQIPIINPWYVWGPGVFSTPLKRTINAIYFPGLLCLLFS